MTLQMLLGQPFEQPAFAVVDRALTGQNLGDRPGLVTSPSMKSGNERRLIDQAVLQGEQADQQVAIRGVACVHEGSRKCGGVGILLDFERLAEPIVERGTESGG